MNTLLKTFFVCTTLVVAWSPTNGLCETPEQAVMAMVNGLKTKGGLPAMVNFIHWQSVFDKMPAREKQQMEITSPADLKKSYQDLFSDPGAMFKRQMQKQKLDPQTAAMLEQQFAGISATIKKQMDEQNAKLARTDFKVTDSSVEGNEATVKMTATVDGTTKQETIKLIKVDEKWMLPGFGFMQQKKPGAGMSPMGRPPMPMGQAGAPTGMP